MAPRKNRGLGPNAGKDGFNEQKRPRPWKRAWEEGLAIEAATGARVEQAEQEARAGQERTQWPPGAGSVGSWNGAGCLGSRNGAGSGADSVGS